jgi:kinesin family protein 1
MPSGSKLTFALTADSVKGLSTHDFSAAHMQVRLSSFIGPTLQSEETFPSNVIDLETATLSDMKLRKPFTIAISSKVLNYLRQGYAPIEFFAKVTPTYLERLERWDEMREIKVPVHSNNLTNGASEPTPDVRPPTLPQMRRSETEFFVEQVHDVAAWLQVRELAPDGQYQPVPVISQSGLDPGCFSLHQGLQRRITITLTSNSGKQLPWAEITRMQVGNIRLLDPKGRVHESTSKAMVGLTIMKNQEVEFKPDGTGYLTAHALWDTSVHESTLLNRVTAANQRVLIRVVWSVAVETCGDPVQFSMDFAVAIHTRDASPPSRFFTFFGSSKVLSKTSTLFSVKLSPPLTRSPRDLWKMDTSEKYVRGEEVLATWKPRGISVVEDHERLVMTERRAADVQAVRTVLAVMPPKTGQAGAAVWAEEELLKKSLGLWQRQFGHTGKACDFKFVRVVYRKVNRGTVDRLSCVRSRQTPKRRMIRWLNWKGLNSFANQSSAPQRRSSAGGEIRSILPK